MGLLPSDDLIAVRLKELMAEIEFEISQLNRILHDGQIYSARVFTLPRILAGQEHEPYKTIAVSETSGPDVLPLASEAFLQFHGFGEDSTKSVFRLPGAIAVTSVDTAQVLETITTINTLKDTFATQVQLLPDRTTRFEMVHSLFPMAITLQITRHLQAYDDSMLSVTFTWGRKSALVDITRDDAIKILQDMKGRPSDAMERMEWLSMFDRDITRLGSLHPDTPLRYRRDLKVHPMANLRLDSGEKRLRDAHLPILILNPGEKFRIGALKDYDASQPPTRGRKNPQRLTEDEPLIKIMPVYRIKS